MTSQPPWLTARLAVAVGCVASAMLLFELVVTRIFSVLFFYHFSFFAIWLVMSGLVLGGIWAARWGLRGEASAVFSARLARLAWAFSAAMLVATVLIKFLPGLLTDPGPSLPLVTVYAAVFLPGLVAAGAFLAAAFARAGSGIGGLYACDLVAAAAACVAAIGVMRMLPGPAAFLAPAVLAAFRGRRARRGPRPDREHRAGRGFCSARCWDAWHGRRPPAHGDRWPPTATRTLERAQPDSRPTGSSHG
jgi:hypothetical protein